MADGADCDTVAPVPQGDAPFAVFNRTANLAVRAVLSSPLHPVLSHRLALITVTGRRSGRRSTFPVGYRQAGDRVIVSVGSPEREHWWRNLRHGDRVEMPIGVADAKARRRLAVTSAQG